MTENRYQEAVKRFFEVYRPIGRKYNLHMAAKFANGEPGTLKIYQGEYEDRRLIVKVSEKEDLMCYERARDELESWVKRQEKESMWNKTA